LRSHFRPELLNRVDEIIMFKPLSFNNIKDIVVKLMHELEERLKDQDIHLYLTEEAKEFIANNGFDPVYGARTLKRFIQRNVETLLASELLKGNIGEKDQVQILVKEGQLFFEKIS